MWKTSVFSHILTEYGEIQSISLYLVRMKENTDQKNSEHGLFLRSVLVWGHYHNLKNLVPLSVDLEVPLCSNCEYRLCVVWLPFSINKVFKLAKLRKVTCIYMFIYVVSSFAIRFNIFIIYAIGKYVWIWDFI